jgi:hypothetical protein
VTAGGASAYVVFSIKKHYFWTLNRGAVMKNLWAVLLMTLALFFSCGKKSPTEPAEDFSRYFPLEVNNKWYFYYPPNSAAKVTYRIWETQTVNDHLYYLYGNKSETSDLFRKDELGNVYKNRPAGELLWFNFQTADGGTYQVKLSDLFIYTVTVEKNQTVTYRDPTFEGCVRFTFDAPTIKDEEITYTIAPEIGIVQMMGAWVTMYLDSYEFPR